MCAAIGRQKKPVTTTIVTTTMVTTTILFGGNLNIVQKLPMGAAHAQKVRRSVDKVRFILFLVANISDKLHFTNI
jgi:hypothetical protein